jgi:hypothetical protein
MPKIAFVLFVLFSFGPPFYSGFVGGEVLAPLGWSAGMAIFAIATGWRAPGRGTLASALIGLCFATAVCVPIYFVGRWLGNPAPRSTAFTVTEFILGLLIFGSLALTWRRMQAHQPASHKPPPSDKTRVSPEVEAIFKKLDRLMDDEKAQIDGLPEPFRSEVRSGADCDQIPGAAGEFGRDPQNPIPVNGPLGQMIYLSNLRTATSQKIMFHRLGSFAKIDAYETVSLDGAVWDILLFDLYHPRKSRRAPTGYRIATGAERERLLLGANDFVASFPDQLPDAIANTNERLLGGRMRPRQVREAIERINFMRPADHESRLNSVLAVLRVEARPTLRSEETEHKRQNEHQINLWAPRKIGPTRRTPQNCLRKIPFRSRSDSLTFTPTTVSDRQRKRVPPVFNMGPFPSFSALWDPFQEWVSSPSGGLWGFFLWVACLPPTTKERVSQIDRPRFRDARPGPSR